MNKTKRAGIAAALRAAKPLLWDGSEETRRREWMICHALRDTGHPYESKAREMVMHRLGDAPGLGTWLMMQGITWNTHRQVQLHRLAWLDQMIAEFDSAPTSWARG